MATTTNYGWATPDDTALVKDGASAIRTLGSSVDTTTKALNPETTLGDISYRSSSANVKTRLGIGSTGNVLTVAGGVPTWAAPAGGGKVLQVVSATTTSLATLNTTTFTDTNLTATITPTLSTSKILVLTTQSVRSTRAAADTAGNIRLVRDSTAIYTFDGRNGLAFDVASGSPTNIRVITSITYLDSPATTSATTYKTQGAVAEAAGTSELIFQNNSIIGSMILLEIGA